MKAEWKATLYEDEVGRGFVFIQKGKLKETYASFSPAEMEDGRNEVEEVLQEAHVIAHDRNTKVNQNGCANGSA